MLMAKGGFISKAEEWRTSIPPPHNGDKESKHQTGRCGGLMVGLSWVGGCKTALLPRRGCPLWAAPWVQRRELPVSLMEKRREAARLSAFLFSESFS